MGIRDQIMGASQAATAAPAQSEDERFMQNVEKAHDAALNVFYDEKAHDHFMQMIPDGDEIGGVAVVAATLIEAVDEHSGGNMPEEVIFPAAVSVMVDIMDFLTEKDGKHFTDGDKARGMHLLMVKLGKDYNTTPEQMQQALQELPPEMLQEAQGQMQQQPEQQDGLLARAQRGA